MHLSFDVFISHSSQDAKMANELASFLTKNGLEVFCAGITLPKIGLSNFREIIDSAVDQSTHMIIVASSLANIESKWVAFEWGSFANNLRSGKDGNFVTVVSFDFDPKKFPLALRNHEIIPYSKENFERIQRYLPKTEQKESSRYNALENEKEARPSSGSRSKFLTQMPYLQPDFSISRIDDIRKIAGLFQNRHRAIVLAGIGGIGKTTLAKMFVENQATSYDFILWIEYVNNIYTSFLAQTYTDLIGFTWDPAKKDEENLSLYIESLNGLPGRKLIVIDNINNEEDMKIALKHHPVNSDILFTSRYKPLLVKCYFPKPLTPTEAKSLFYQYYFGKPDDENLDLLIEMVHFHTLTIELLAKTAESLLNSNIKKLYENFKKNRLSSNEFKKVNIPLHYDKRLVETQMYNFVLELFDISDLDNNEKGVLANFAVLPYIDFSEEELVYLFINATQEDGQAEETIVLSNLLARLIRKGWIIKEGQNFRLHPVLQEVLRNKLEISPIDVERVTQSVTGKLKLSKDQLSIQDLKENEILKFVDIAISISTFFTEQKQFSLADLNFNLSIILQQLLRYDESLTFQQKVISTLTTWHPGKTELLANSYDHIALILRELARYDEAIIYEKSAIGLKKDKSLFGSLELSFTYHRLSSVYALKGHLKPALKYLLMAVKLREVKSGTQDLATVNSYHDLAALYADLGNIKRAELYIKQVLQTRELLIPVSIDCANSYSVYSTVTYLKGDFEKSLEYQQKAHALYLKVLYRDHWRIGHSFSKLALVNLALDNLHVATDFQKEAVRIKELVFGKEHPLTAFAYNVSALISFYTDDFHDALKLQRTVLQIRKKCLYKHSMDTGNTYLRLAEIHIAFKELGDAKSAVAKAKGIFIANDLDANSVFMEHLRTIESVIEQNS